MKKNNEREGEKEMPDVNVRYGNFFLIKKWSHM